MSLVHVEVEKNTKNAVVCSYFVILNFKLMLENRIGTIHELARAIMDM